MIPDPGLIELVASMIVIPWCVWVSTSIFNQRQELAVLKEILQYIKERDK